MSGLMLVNAIVCTLLAMRLLFFRRKGARWRPRAALLAYFIIVAAASVPIGLLLGSGSDTTTLPQLVLNTVLCVAVFAVDGNVSELFRRNGDKEGIIARTLRWHSWF
ncbi:phage holin family protein [Paludibacterium yongneupense]|uniref:phage holin family protein n=1 Tax=Paludibacterium yongneupense TaxID=400061 RepID=UPI0003F8A75C|nr:phage holin family protein [Paludibacterium yongneupense]